MSDPSFFRFAPETFRVLGFKLKTLSIGHVHLLQAIDSPFLSGGAIDMDDLVAGVFICSRNWKSNLWHQRHWRLHNLYMLLWQRLVGPFNLLEKKILFADYLHRHYEMPIYRSNLPENERPFEPSGAPVSVTVRTTLMAEFGLREADLWDRPWQESVMDCMTLKAARGEISFPGITREDVQSAKDVAESIAERIKSGKIKIPKK